MDKITYERDVEGKSRETTKIDFEFESDLNIKEFKRLCVRLAYSLGYGENSIKENSTEDLKTNLKKLFKINATINGLVFLNFLFAITHRFLG